MDYDTWKTEPDTPHFRDDREDQDPEERDLKKEFMNRLLVFYAEMEIN